MDLFFGNRISLERRSGLSLPTTFFAYSLRTYYQPRAAFPDTGSCGWIAFLDEKIPCARLAWASLLRRKRGDRRTGLLEDDYMDTLARTSCFVLKISLFPPAHCIFLVFFPCLVGGSKGHYTVSGAMRALVVLIAGYRASL